MVITPGEEVEVSSPEEGFKDAWYKATVLATRKGKGSVLVRYQTLLTDGSDTDFLEEYTSYSFIRPLPPLDLVDGDERQFEEQDVVDANDRDGWWKGVVAKVRVLEDNSKIYTVVFDNINPPEESEYLPSLLRLHMDWVDGQWVRPPKAQRMEGLPFSRGMAVEVNMDQGDRKYGWIPAIVLGEVGFRSFLVECNTLTDRDKSGPMEVTVDSFQIRPPAPSLEVKEFELFDKVEAFYSCGWMQGHIISILTEGRYGVLISDVNEEKELNHSCIRPLMKLENGNWIVFSGSKEMMMEAYLLEKFGRAASANNFNEVILTDEETTEDENPSQHSKKSPSLQSDNCHQKYKRKKAKQRKPDLWHPHKKAKTKGNTKSVATENVVNSDRHNEICPLHVPELDIHGEGHSQQKVEDKTTRGGASGLNFEDGASYLNFEDSASDEVEFLTMKPIGEEDNDGNGGRWMKDCTGKQNDAVMSGGGGTENCTSTEVELPTAIGTECEHMRIECGSSRMDSEGYMSIDIELPITTIVDHIGDGANGMDYEECATEDVESSQKMQVVHVGSEHIVSRCKMQFIDCGVTKEDELLVKTSLASAGKDQCLPSDEDAELAEGTGTGAGKGEELIMELPEIPETTPLVPGGDSKGISSCVVEVPATSELVEHRMLPFVKESVIWEAVESLKVFQALPQRPHFHPLFECKENDREGLAIGHMVTFSRLAEKILKLRVCDYQDIFHSYLDSLAELEKHGFDITSLVHRLNELLSIRDKRDMLQHQFKKVQTQIVECSHGKAKLKEDIDNMDKRMKKLQEEREKKCDELTAMELEATALELAARGTNADISNADEEFDNIVAASW